MTHSLLIRGLGNVPRDQMLKVYGGGPGDGLEFRAIEAVPHLNIRDKLGADHIYRIRHITKGAGLTELGLWYARNCSGQSRIVPDHGPTPLPLEPER